MRIFQSLASDTVRNIHWGPSSNAGGHPMDLHSPEAPLSHPDSLTDRVPLATSSAKPTTGGKQSFGLNITPIVRNHLFSVFFEAIQPAWPIVTKKSLVHYPCTTILETAILGVAARHHTAIVSWRDLAHIQETIDAELRNLFNLRDHREHSIQTLQALLLLSLRVELCAKSHQDLQRLPFRIAFACQIAQDLKCHLPPTEMSGNDCHDINLRRTLWAACIFVDTHSSAILGQEMNISVAHNHDFSLIVYPLDSTPIYREHRFFYTSVGLMACLRSVLRIGYSILPPTGTDLHNQVDKTLGEIEWYQEYLEMNKSQFTSHEWRCLQMIHSNTHLLFILSLRPTTNPPDAKLQGIVSDQLLSVMMQACQTLEWSTSDLIESVSGQLLVTLYSTSRALMVIVDVLRDAECETAFSTSMSRRLWGAVGNAREFMEFLLIDKTWGQKWTQAHTLKAIFQRLSRLQLDHVMGATASSTHSESIALQTEHNLNSTGSEQQDVEIAASIEVGLEDLPLNEDIWNTRGSSMDLSNVILNPTEWETFFEQYDQNMYCPKIS